MDKKTAIATVLSVTITLVVTMIVGKVMGVFERGVDAADEDKIREVVGEMLVTDAGLTHAAALSQIDTALTSISTKVDGIEGDIGQIREALIVIASD